MITFENKNLPLEEFRFERKFTTELSASETEQIIKTNGAMFSEIYNTRFINNIYFDTLDKTCYLKTVDGLNDRVKIRIRWYGDLSKTIDKPILEIKRKSGLLGRKESYLLPPFKLSHHLNNRKLQELFFSANIPGIIREDLFSLKPMLINRYKRKYFLSDDKNFRLTIDSELEFTHFTADNNTFLNHSKQRELTIVELKYDYQNDPLANIISSQFPFRLSKNSKYEQGIDRLSNYML